MPPFSKTLHPADYAWIEQQYVARAWYALEGLHRRLDHHHRVWEWSLALKAIRMTSGRRILDIGGGASIFSPAACLMGCAVTQVDLDNNAACVQQHSDRCGAYVEHNTCEQMLFTPMQFVHGDFMQMTDIESYDAVCAISVIEHVVDYDVFLCKMCDCVSPGGVVIVTTDYHESGAARSDLHLRTYNRNAMLRLQGIATSFGFQPLGGPPEWLNTGTAINGYNFASLIMRRS